MGSIKVGGHIALPDSAYEKSIACRGYVSEEAQQVPPGPVKAGTQILKIFSDELLAAQERWISRNRCEWHTCDPILRTSMTPGQLRWITTNKKAIRNIGIECPIAAHGGHILAPGKEFGPGKTLFAYGAPAITCRLPAEIAAHLRPDGLARLTPRAFSGRVESGAVL